jgi:phosphohistidine phosphatase
MKTLTLLRHAKSSWKNPGLIDHDRPLNKRGKRDVPLMGERIQMAGIRPSLILSSTAVRAWRTAKGIAKEISYPREFLQREQRLYHAGVNRILDVLAQQDDAFNSIMIVGHNPGLTDFANYLVPDVTSNIPTCGFVSVTIDAEDWNLKGDHKVELAAYDYPKKKQ